MRDLFLKFRKSEDGASLVEYAVALIVVVIIGGAGVIALGTNASSLVDAGCGTVSDAADSAGTVGTNAQAALDAIDCS